MDPPHLPSQGRGPAELQGAQWPSAFSPDPLELSSGLVKGTGGGADGWSLWEMGIQQGQGSQGTKTLAEATGLESDQISLSLEAAK